MMRYLLASLLLLSVPANLNAAKEIIKTPIVVAHYMSWYQTPDVSGSWGFWQVNRPTIPEQY